MTPSRIPIIGLALLLSAGLAPTAGAEPAPLTEADRIALDEQLEKIEELSDERVGGLYRRALRDFRSAIQSDAGTMELYLKCLEKVQFTDEKKKPADFREWRRRNKERTKTQGMRMALRHQLSWLLLSIEAAKREGDVDELGGRAIKHLDQIFANAETLKSHRLILSQNALDSVFARAYKLNIKVKDWPKSSLDISGIYDKVVMPQLRKPTKVGQLRQAWAKRIEHEGLKIERWSGKTDQKKIGTKESLRSPAFEKFLAETRPDMQWKREMDCFKAGDQRVAALNMIGHLNKHLAHKNAPDWIQQFKELLHPEDKDADKTGKSVAEAIPSEP